MANAAVLETQKTTVYANLSKTSTKNSNVCVYGTHIRGCNSPIHFDSQRTNRTVAEEPVDPRAGTGAGQDADLRQNGQPPALLLVRSSCVGAAGAQAARAREACACKRWLRCVHSWTDAWSRTRESLLPERAWLRASVRHKCRERWARLSSGAPRRTMSVSRPDRALECTGVARYSCSCGLRASDVRMSVLFLAWLHLVPPRPPVV